MDNEGQTWESIQESEPLNAVWIIYAYIMLLFTSHFILQYTVYHFIHLFVKSIFLEQSAQCPPEWTWRYIFRKNKVQTLFFMPKDE